MRFQPLIAVTLKRLVVSSSADRDLEILHSLLIFTLVEKRVADSYICTPVVSVVFQNLLPRLVGFFVFTLVIKVCRFGNDLSESGSCKYGNGVFTGIKYIKMIVMTLNGSRRPERSELLARTAHDKEQPSFLVVLEDPSVLKIENIHLPVWTDINIGKARILCLSGVVGRRPVAELKLAVNTERIKNIVSFGVKLFYKVGRGYSRLCYGINEALVDSRKRSQEPLQSVQRGLRRRIL